MLYSSTIYLLERLKVGFSQMLWGNSGSLSLRQLIRIHDPSHSIFRRSKLDSSLQASNSASYIYLESVTYCKHLLRSISYVTIEGNDVQVNDIGFPFHFALTSPMWCRQITWPSSLCAITDTFLKGPTFPRVEASTSTAIIYSLSSSMILNELKERPACDPASGTHPERIPAAPEIPPISSCRRVRLIIRCGDIFKVDS